MTDQNLRTCSHLLLVFVAPLLKLEYIGDGLISPTSKPLTPGPSGTLYDDETLDWGSEVDEYTLTFI